MLHVRRMMGTANSSSSKLIRFNPEFTTSQTMVDSNDSENVVLVTSQPNIELRRRTDGIQNSGYTVDDEADRLSLQQQETSLTITPPTTITCAVCSKGLSNGELIGGNNLPYLKTICEECFKASSDGVADDVDNKDTDSEANDQEFIQEFAIQKSDSDHDDGDVDSLSENFFTTKMNEEVPLSASSTSLGSIKEPEPPRPVTAAMDKVRLPRAIICAGCEEGRGAIKLCNECGYICDDCVDAHMKFRQLQRHTVSVVDDLKQPEPSQHIDGSHGRAVQKQETVMSTRRQCDTHPDFELVLYCKSPQCQIPICAICTLDTHDKLHGHAHVKLQDAVDEAMTQIKKTSAFLTDKKDLAMNVKFTLEKAKNALAEQHTDKVKELNEVVKELHGCVDGHHAAALSKLEHLHKNETQRLEDNSESMQSISDQINTSYELVKSASGITQCIEVLETRDKIKESLRMLESADMAKEILTPKSFPFSKQHYSAVDTLKQSLNHLFDLNDSEKEQEASPESLSTSENNESEDILEDIKSAVSDDESKLLLENHDIRSKEQVVNVEKLIDEDLQANEEVTTLEKLVDEDLQVNEEVATLEKLIDKDLQANEEVATFPKLEDQDKQAGTLRELDLKLDEHQNTQGSPHPKCDQPQELRSDFEDVTDGSRPHPVHIKSASLIHNSPKEELPVIGGIAAMYELNGEFQPPKQSEPSTSESENQSRDQPQRSQSRNSQSSMSTSGSTHSGRQSENGSEDNITESLNLNTFITDIKSANIVSRNSPSEPTQDLPVIGGIAALWELNGDFQPKESMQSPPESPRQQRDDQRQRSSSRNSVSSANGSTYSGFSRHSDTSSEVMFNDGGLMSSGIVKSADLISHDLPMDSSFNGGIAALYELNGHFDPDALPNPSPPQSPDHRLRRSRSSSISSEISLSGSLQSGFSRSRSSSRSSRGSVHSESSRGSSRSLEPNINNTRNTYSALPGSPETGVRCITMSSLSTSPPSTPDLSKRSNKMDQRLSSSKPVKIDPSLCVAVLDKNLRLRKSCKTIVRTFNSLGDPVRTGGADIRVLLEYDDSGWQTADGKVVVLDHLDGSYTIKFTPCWYGNHRLSVTINGIPIQNSPFMFWVPYCM